ncbi:LysM peptidoglycan-binding domain-containing protein [Alicyclobacillus fodiniaquatilis]|uniref:LysM peptidoglycan-binding domain-containing protein n=1 Tax=Alicyclobacillus fodiniaquatilis TaxID=1661150 RepID=A0ABW4JEG0_9BACL
MEIHVVQRGESLFTIARNYSVRWKDISNINLLPPARPLFPGRLYSFLQEHPKLNILQLQC